MEKFIHTSIRLLVEAYRVQYAHIGLFTDERLSQVRTLATWAEGKFSQNISYALSTALSIKILTEKTILIPQSIKSFCPEDKLFATLAIESYLATLLISPLSNKRLGILVVMDTTPLAVTIWTTAIFEMVAQRIAFEIERNQSMQTIEQMKETYLAEIHQNIRTPLNNILNIVECLSTGPLNTQQRHCVDALYESTASLLQITQDTPSFLVPTGIQPLLGFKDFELSTLLDEIMRTCIVLAEKKQVALMYHIATKVPLNVRANVNQLQQILTDLLNYIVKMVTKGEVLIFITLLEEQREKIYLRFKLRVLGTRLERKFVDKTAELTAIQQSVREMGGQLHLKQQNVFLFAIGLEKASLESDLRKFYQQLILIIDSNNTQRQLLQAQSRKWGLQTIVAKDTQIALKKLKALSNQIVSIALISVPYSATDSIAFTEYFQKYLNILTCPIILLTTKDHLFDEKILKAHNIVAQLTKPISLNLLHTVLHHHLTLSPMSRTCSVEKILVVDDSDMNRDVLVGMLDRLGYEADAVEDGQQALTVLEEQAYALIFMDFEMPILDGCATAREIRHRERLHNKPRIPIIALTAYASEEHDQQSRDAGMDNYLTKPLRLQTLRDTLARWLPLKPGIEDAPQATTDTLKSSDMPPIDFKILARLQEIMGLETVQLLAEQFARYATQQLGVMQQSLQCHDTETLRRKAHQLKGESLQIGAIPLGNLCKTLETLAKEQRLDAISACLLTIESEIQRVNTTMEKNHCE